MRVIDNNGVNDIITLSLKEVKITDYRETPKRLAWNGLEFLTKRKKKSQKERFCEWSLIPGA